MAQVLFNGCCDPIVVDPLCPCEDLIPLALTSEFLVLDKQDGNSTTNYSGEVTFTCCDGSETLTLTSIDFGVFSDILSSADIGTTTTDGTFDFDIDFLATAVVPLSFTVGKVIVTFTACGVEITKTINVTVKDTCVNSYPGLLETLIITLDIIEDTGTIAPINIPYEFICCNESNDFVVTSYTTLNPDSGITILLPEVGENVTIEELAGEYQFDGLNAVEGTYDIDATLKFCNTVTRKQKIRFIITNFCESIIPTTPISFPDITFHDDGENPTEVLNFTFGWDCCIGGAEYLGFTSLDNGTGITYNGLPPNVGTIIDDSILETINGVDGAFNENVNVIFDLENSIGKSYTLFFNFRFCGTDVVRTVNITEEVPIAPFGTAFPNNFAGSTANKSVFISGFGGLDLIAGSNVVVYDTSLTSDYIALTTSVHVPTYRDFPALPDAPIPDMNYLYTLSDIQNDSNIIQTNLLTNTAGNLINALNCASKAPAGSINNASVPDADGKPKTMSTSSILTTTTGTLASMGILVDSGTTNSVVRVWNYSSGGGSIISVLENDPLTAKLVNNEDWSTADIYNPTLIARKYPSGANRFFYSYHVIDINEALDGYLRFEVELGTLVNSTLKWRVAASAVSQIKGGFSTTGTITGGVGIGNNFTKDYYLPLMGASAGTSNNSCYWDGSKYQYLKATPFVSPAATPTLFSGSPYVVNGKFPMQLKVNNVDQVVIVLIADQVGTTDMTAGTAGSKATFAYHIDNFEYFV